MDGMKDGIEGWRGEGGRGGGGMEEREREKEEGLTQFIPTQSLLGLNFIQAMPGISTAGPPTCLPMQAALG